MHNIFALHVSCVNDKNLWKYWLKSALTWISTRVKQYEYVQLILTNESEIATHQQFCFRSRPILLSGFCLSFGRETARTRAGHSFCWGQLILFDVIYDYLHIVSSGLECNKIEIFLLTIFFCFRHWWYQYRWVIDLLLIYQVSV